MKLIFNGWRRTVYTHNVQVNPIKPGSYGTMGQGKPMVWNGPLATRGKVSSLALSGDFSLDIQFEDAELENWLEAYVKGKPAEALRLLARMHAEAVIAVAEAGREDSAEE